MFGFKKKEEKREELVAPITGKLIPIEEVSDPVFSEKMMGDGFAIASTGDCVYACGNATVSMLFPSNHAVGLTLDDGMEILLHVGIDTVNENGKGFTCYCEQDKKVLKGDKLLSFDRPYLTEKGYDLTLIAVFTNKHSYKEFKGTGKSELIGGKDIAVTYTK
ncbi:PTS sugar transporter subunit IIA [Anaerorhabdus sp.]|uniref:PTS sugar transporter subunit IIA n=1 Tax=Anaerorhabdus sp. TaxID=1872524 RepID=UPI002FC6F989